MLGEGILKATANSQAKESCDLFVVVFTGNAGFFLFVCFLITFEIVLDDIREVALKLSISFF